MRTNARAVDMELNTLKNVFKFAVRSGWLKHNPLDFRRTAYCLSGDVRHCRDCAPKDANELHSHAIYFFEDPQSEVYGWQLLFEALTGCRTSEALALRMDAKNESEPGFIANGVLWLARAKGGSNNFFSVHEALSAWLCAFHRWHQARFPASPWWFPGSGGQKLDTGRLSKALRRSAKMICAGAPRTSHGLRSYYVTVRRSQGASDGQITIELGQRTGPSIINRVYGEATPRKLAWLPEAPMRPAWEMWAETKQEAK